MAMYSTVFGMDVHARSTTICALCPDTGETEIKRFVDNPFTEMAVWMQSFPYPSYAVYESGCCGFHPVRELRSNNINVDVIAVSRLPKSPRDYVAKNDRNDAIRLAKAAVCGDAVAVYVPSQEAEGLRKIASALDDAALRVKVAKLQISSFLLTQGYVWNAKTAKGNTRRQWCQDHRDWLRKIAFEDRFLQQAYLYYLSTLDELESQQKDILSFAKKAVSQSSLEPTIAALQAMKGCGFSLALAFASELEDFSRFKRGRAVSSYFGLVPREGSSGEKESYGAVTKCGNSLVRKLAIEGSWTYLGASPKPKKLAKELSVSPEVAQHARRGSERLRKKRDHLSARGLHGCKVNVAIAAELVRWLWAIGRMVQEK